MVGLRAMVLGRLGRSPPLIQERVLYPAHRPPFLRAETRLPAGGRRGGMVAERCSRCDSEDVVYIVYGHPSEEMVERSLRGDVVLAAPRFGLGLPIALASSVGMSGEPRTLSAGPNAPAMPGFIPTFWRMIPDDEPRSDGPGFSGPLQRYESQSLDHKG